MANSEANLSETSSHSRRRVVEQVGKGTVALLACVATVGASGHILKHAKETHDARVKQNKALIGNLLRAIEADGFGEASTIHRNLPIIGRLPIANLVVSTDCILNNVEMQYTEDGEDITDYRFYVSERDAVTFNDRTDLQENILGDKKCLPNSSIMPAPPHSVDLP
jgi:hypothetical protein